MSPQPADTVGNCDGDCSAPAAEPYGTNQHVHVLLLQEEGQAARAEILRDPRNHGPVADAPSRLKAMHLDYEDFSTIR